MFVGTQTEREEKVSLELSEEILQSMEVGMAFKDYVSNSTITFSVLILDLGSVSNVLGIGNLKICFSLYSFP